MAITDFESAQTWLEGQPHEVQVGVAARCALRALPGLGKEEHAILEVVSLPVLRAALTSGVAAVCRVPVEIEVAESAGLAASSSQFVHTAASASTAARSAGSAGSSNSAANAAIHSGDSAAAFLADRSTQSTAFSLTISAADRDAMRVVPGNVAKLFETSLWPDGGVPTFFADSFDRVSAFWSAAPETWEFWLRWYDGMLTGNPLPWELQEKVALIPETVWEAGAEAIAAEIAAIERERGSGVPLEVLKQVVAQARRHPVLYKDAATVTGEQISTAIAQFKTDTRCNPLPDGFQAFEYLPQTYIAIAEILETEKGRDRTSRLEQEIARLHSIIGQLRADLRDSRQKLNEARLTRVEASVMRTRSEKLVTTLTAATLLGSLGMNLFMFFGGNGELRYSELKDEIEALTTDMRNVEAAPDVNVPTETGPGPKFIKP